MQNAQALRSEVSFLLATWKFTRSIYSGLIPLINQSSYLLNSQTSGLLSGSSSVLARPTYSTNSTNRLCRKPVRTCSTLLDIYFPSAVKRSSKLASDSKQSFPAHCICCRSMISSPLCIPLGLLFSPPGLR